MNKKYCINCGSKENLVELNNGAFACMECLDVIAKEQKGLREAIKKEFGGFKEDDVIKALINIMNFVKETSIKTFDHLIDSLEAINYAYEIENGSIDPKVLEELQEILKKWENNLDNQ